MTLEIAGFLVIFVVALILFSLERFSPDVTALGLMMTLIITGMLTPQEAFAGFGSETVLMIFGLLIMTEALARTGIVDIVGRYMLRFVGTGPKNLRLILLLAPAFVSSFFSNTASVAFFMPITLGIAHRTKLSVSRMLMPLAFAAILASSVTLIATSTNLVVSGLMQQLGLAPLGMFELTPVGLPILVGGLLYMHFIGRRLIPDRTGTQEARTTFGERLYVSEVEIMQGSAAVGQRIEETVIMTELNLGVLQMRRDDTYMKPLADTLLQAGDVLFVEGKREDILNIQNTSGIRLRGVVEELGTYIQGQKAKVAEVMLLPDSPLIGRTIRGLQLRERYKIQILAINQSGKITYTKIGRRRLNLGDVLLVQILEENLHLLEAERLFRVMDIVENAPTDLRRALLSSAIFIGSLGLAVIGIFPIAVAVLLGSLLIFLTRCISPEEAYHNIEWKTLILIACMLAFGQAMQQTGTADFLAAQIAGLPVQDAPLLLLSLFFGLAVLLTQPMSNQAAAAVLLPIAAQTAVLLGFNPRPFAVMIALAASCSFITPLEPGCVLIYSAGKYRFFDFVKVGGILTILIYIIAIALVPLIWQI